MKSDLHFEPVFTAQMLTYLRITGLKTGLLLNFNRLEDAGASSLSPLEDMSPLQLSRRRAAKLSRPK